MPHISDVNTGLHAVPQCIDTYRDKAGFRHQDTRHIIVCETDHTLSENLVKFAEGIQISAIHQDNEENVMSYDHEINGHFCRSKLMKSWFREEGTLSLAAVNCDDHSVIRGYICIKTNNIRKAVVGPLFADSDDIAEFLLFEAIQRFPLASEAGLIFFAVDSTDGSLKIVSKLQLEQHEVLPRLFTKEVPQTVSWNRIYCLASPNFSPFWIFMLSYHWRPQVTLLCLKHSFPIHLMTIFPREWQEFIIKLLFNLLLVLTMIWSSIQMTWSGVMNDLCE